MRLRALTRSVIPAAALLTLALIPLWTRQADGQTSAAAASGGADPVIRSETRVVLVDAVAVDRKNRFARDLTQKDFRVWEDGKEQKITSFSLESTGLSPERSSRHYILLFFDTSTLGPSALLTVRQDAMRFVDTFASPDRYMAVIEYGGEVKILQNFTADAARLKGALMLLQDFSPSGPATAAATAAAPRVPQRRTPAPAPEANGYRHMLESLRAVAGSVAEIRGRKALVLFSGGADAAADLSLDITATTDACNRANVAVYGVLGHGLIGNLRAPGPKWRDGALASLGHGLAYVLRGASGNSPENEMALSFQRGPAGTAGAANSLSQDASGAPINSSVSGGDTNQNVLRALADGTGGLMLGTSNNLPEELGRIAQEQDEYYLLGYTPSVESREGTCHTLRVKVDRSGLDVRARKGYCTSKPDNALAAKTEGKDLETRAASGSAGNMAVNLQLPWFYSGPNAAQVNVAMDVVPTGMKFQRGSGEKARLHGEFELEGIAYKADGSVAARFSDTVGLDFDTQQEADAFVRKSYHYANQFEVAPGQYSFRMVVAAGSQGFGKAELPLTISAWDGKTPAMSGLALSRDAHEAPDRSSGLADLALERVRPLIAQGMEVVPTGTSQFRAGESGFVYFELYEPALTTRRISLRLRILDRRTGNQIDDSGALKADSFVQAGNPVVPVALTLPIASAGLPPGSYKAEVSVLLGASGTDISRTIDFDVR